jgi:hypothetical protein
MRPASLPGRVSTMRTLRHALAALAAGALIASVQVSAQPPSLDELLARTATYVVAFIPQFANTVAVESYEQRSRQTGGNGRLTPSIPWRLESDVLLVRHPASPLDWMWFRDVGEVDGRRVRRGGSADEALRRRSRGHRPRQS